MYEILCLLQFVFLFFLFSSEKKEKRGGRITITVVVNFYVWIGEEK